MTTSLKRSLEVFSCLCGDSVYPFITLGTTKWPSSPAGSQETTAEETHVSLRKQAEAQFRHLQDCYWENLIKLGSRPYRIEDTESALELVRLILDKLELTTEGGELVLEIQKEVVDEGKAIFQTKRGNMWKPAEVLKNRYAEEGKAVRKQLEEMDRELAELANNKNTFSRVGRSFGRLATRVF